MNLLEQCDDKFLIKYSIHERELLGNQVVSLENENLVILVEMFINDKFVEIISCSKLMLAKECNLCIHQFLESPCWPRWCILCIHLFLNHLDEKKEVEPKTLNQALVGRQSN